MTINFIFYFYQRVALTLLQINVKAVAKCVIYFQEKQENKIKILQVYENKLMSLYKKRNECKTGFYNFAHLNNLIYCSVHFYWFETLADSWYVSIIFMMALYRAR